MSDEHYPEFTSAQTERLDEIDNAVYQTILAFLNKSEDEFPWDMYYIGAVADSIEETLLSMGQRVHRPVIVAGKDGISRIEEYQYPPKTKPKQKPKQNMKGADPKYKGFLALYYHYCYLLGRIEKRQYPPRMTPHLRQEIMKAETYKARLKFLQENNITTADDLTACMQQAGNAVTQLAKQRTILNVRKKKRKKLFDALAAEESLAMSKALYEEGLSDMEAEYAQYAEAKATLDACGISRQALTEEKSNIYEQLAQLNKQIRAERQKIKLCREIADSAAVMQRDVAAQEKFPHEKETEHLRTNRR